MAHESIIYLLEYCRKKTMSSINKIDQILPSLFHLIVKNKGGEILGEALQTLQFLTDICDDIVIEDEAFKRIILLLSHNDLKLKNYAIYIMCNVIPGLDEQMQLYMLSYFPSLVEHHDNNIRLKSMSCLSKLAAFSQTGKQAIIETDLFLIISNNLKSDSLEIIIRAVDVVNKFAFEAREHQILHLFETGTISTFCDLLKYKKREIVEVII